MEMTINNERMINECLKDLTLLQPLSNKKLNQVSGNQLREIINIAKEAQEYIMPLLRRINNKNVIEQAAVMKGLNRDNINDSKIGNEIAKYLQMRLNAISDFSERIRIISWRLFNSVDSHPQQVRKIDNIRMGFKFII